MAGTTIQGLAIGAQHAASRRLKQAHLAEWESYHEEERVKRGLNRYRRASSAEIAEENRKLRERIAELQAEEL